VPGYQLLEYEEKKKEEVAQRKNRGSLEKRTLSELAGPTAD